MKDKLQKHSRWLLLVVSVIVIHLIIGIAIRGCSATPDTTEKITESKQENPGWLKRLFSGKKEKKVEETEKEENYKCSVKF